MLTDEQLAVIERCIHGGCTDRDPEVDCRLLLNEVKRLRATLGACDDSLVDATTELDMANAYVHDLAAQVADLRDALDALVADQGCWENGEYDLQSARDAEALLDRMTPR